MLAYQRDFLKFAIDIGMLRFGSFTLKSGRISPYFFNAGLFNTGSTLATAGQAYAACIAQSKIAFDVLYGPAYKGIPLATSTSIALANQGFGECPYAFNRKEAKDHGEGGIIVGTPLAGRILIIDDVISAGTSVRESVDIIRQANATPAAVVIALDRQERGSGKETAVMEVTEKYAIPVFSIITLTDVMDYLQEQPDSDALLEKMHQYRQEYGA